MNKNFLFFLFPFSIVIDVINGYLQLQLGLITPIGVIYRGGLFAYMLHSFLKNKVGQSMFILVTGLVIFSLMLWMFFYGANIIKELEFVVRYAYFFAVLNYLYVYRMYYKEEFMLKYVRYYGLLIALVIILCYVTGLGFSSYGDGEYGWGTTGFFIANNDLGLTLVCCLIMSCVYYNLFPTSSSLIGIMIIAVGGVLVGSRVCFVLVPLVLLFQMYSAFMKTKYKFIVGVFIVCIIFVVVSISIIVYETFDDYALARLTVEGFENARTILTDEARHYIALFDPLTFFFGAGVQNLHMFVGQKLGIGVERYVEADYYEIVGSYGYLLGGILLYAYLRIVYLAFMYYLKNRNINTLFLFFICFFFVGAGLFAGHAATNMMATPVLAVSTMIVLNKREKDQE